MDILEIIGMLIVGAIYFFGNFLSNKSEDKGPESPEREFESADEADAAERQRRIQAEIRRKIMERRRAAEGAQPPERPAVEAARESVREERRQPPTLARAPKPVSSGPFRMDASDNEYEQSMEAQLKRIEETKRRAAQLKKQAGMGRPPTAGTRTARRSPSERRTFAGPVRTALKNPAAARTAFIYGEVLGQPISMRKQSNVPGLS